MSSNLYSTVLFDLKSCSINKNQYDREFQILYNYAYGVILPIICAFGIVGNIFNILVLTRKHMIGTAYIYMRSYSIAALLAIIFAIPFAFRIIVHQDSGVWINYAIAFYFSHLELFLGNCCLGIGVMMLLALTLERYFALCHPEKRRPIFNTTYTLLIVIFGTIILYSPSIFRKEIIVCQENSKEFYVRKDNTKYINSTLFLVYKIILELMYKVVPTVLLTFLNLKIIQAYKKSNRRRLERTLHHLNNDNDIQNKQLSEEKRLLFLLGSTSLLFLICVSPMAVLNITLSQANLSNFNFQVFRALANLLELLNYSITFYIYYMFSKDFQRTFFALWKRSSSDGATITSRTSKKNSLP